MGVGEVGGRDGVVNKTQKELAWWLTAAEGEKKKGKKEKQTKMRHV